MKLATSVWELELASLLLTVGPGTDLSTNQFSMPVAYFSLIGLHKSENIENADVKNFR